MRKEIDSSQLSVFVFIAVMALKIFMVPGLLIKHAGRDGWISMLTFVVIELIVLLAILFIIKLNPDKSVYDILVGALGKVVAKGILLIFAALLFVKLIIMCGELELFFNSSMLKSIDFVVCFIALLVLLVIFSSKGLRPIARMAQIFFPFVLGALLILFLLTVGNLKLDGLTPLSFNMQEIAFTMSKFPIWFGDVAVLLIFTGKIKVRKRFILKGMLTGAISGIIVMYFAIVLFAAYGDYPIIIDYGHNISNMIVYSSGSYLFGRFDIPIFCIWMISIFVQIAVSFYAIVSFFGSVIEKGSDTVWAIVVAIALFVLCQIFFNSKSELLALGTGVTRWLCLVIQIILPAMVLIISLINRSREKKNDIQT